MRSVGKRGDSKAKASGARKKEPLESEDPRERIRREASRLMARRGFGAISLNDVAQAAGLSKQALLYHYPSREALHEAVLDSLVAQSNRHLVLLLGALSGPGEERLTRVMVQLREFFDAEPDAAGVILRELLDGEHTCIARLVQGLEPWLRLATDTVRQGQREGRFRPELDAEAAVAHVGSLLLTSFALGWRTSGWPQAADPDAWRERWLNEAVLIIQRYLFTQPASPPRRAVRARRQQK